MAHLVVWCIARQIDRAADHQLRDLFFVGVAGLKSATLGSVPQNANPFGDLENLFHPVRNINDSNTLVL